MLQVMKPTPTRASPAASISSRQPCFIAITTANNTEPLLRSSQRLRVAHRQRYPSAQVELDAGYEAVQSAALKGAAP